MAGDSSDDTSKGGPESKKEQALTDTDRSSGQSGESLFSTSDDAIAASMDDAFDDIVRKSNLSDATLTKPSWWYVENGRRIGPVSRTQVIEAVHKQVDPKNVLVWNEGFPTWKRFGESPLAEQHRLGHEGESEEEDDGDAPPLISDSPSNGGAVNTLPTNVDLRESNSLTDYSVIEEELLEPEGEPIDNWVPKAAAALRDIDSSGDHRSTANVLTWEDEEEDYGLPPTLSTAEFQREDVFPANQRHARATWLTLSALSIALFAGVSIALYEFLGSSLFGESALPSQTAAPSDGPQLKRSAAVQPAQVKEEVRLETSIQASQPANLKAKPQTTEKKKLKRSRRKPKKLPQTITDGALASGLKKKSSTLAPCIEGAVKAKELPSGRHVMVLAYDILPNGRVSGASLVGPNYLLGASLSRCVESTMSSWRFSKTAKGRVVRDQELAFRARAP